MEGAFLLDVVVAQGSTIFELLAREDEALLVGRDALLVLDLLLDVVDRVARLDVERDGLARERLDEDLRSGWSVRNRFGVGGLGAGARLMSSRRPVWALGRGGAAAPRARPRFFFLSGARASRSHPPRAISAAGAAAGAPQGRAVPPGRARGARAPRRAPTRLEDPTWRRARFGARSRCATRQALSPFLTAIGESKERARVW